MVDYFDVSNVWLVTWQQCYVAMMQSTLQPQPHAVHPPSQLQQSGKKEDHRQVGAEEEQQRQAKIEAEQQQAKAAAKKAKKQRQKAKRQQAQALGPCGSELDSSAHSTPRVQSPDAQATQLQVLTPNISEALGSCAKSSGSSLQDQDLSHQHQNSADAHMLNLFRCPLTKVSSACCEL